MPMGHRFIYNTANSNTIKCNTLEIKKVSRCGTVNCVRVACVTANSVCTMDLVKSRTLVTGRNLPNSRYVGKKCFKNY